QNMGAIFRVTAPPGIHRLKAQFAPQKMFTDGGQIAQQRRVFEHATTQGVGDGDTASAGYLKQTGHPQLGIPLELDLITEIVIDAAQNDIDTGEAVEG